MTLICSDGRRQRGGGPPAGAASASGALHGGRQAAPASQPGARACCGLGVGAGGPARATRAAGRPVKRRRRRRRLPAQADGTRRGGGCPGKGRHAAPGAGKRKGGAQSIDVEGAEAPGQTSRQRHTSAGWVGGLGIKCTLSPRPKRGLGARGEGRQRQQTGLAAPGAGRSRLLARCGCRSSRGTPAGRGSRWSGPALVARAASGAAAAAAARCASAAAARAARSPWPRTPRSLCSSAPRTASAARS